jgi:hypothetical protein
VTAIAAAASVVWAGAIVAARFLLWDSARGAQVFEQTNTNPMQDVADHFGWLARRVGKPVVFFIDNADRCSQTYVVELLEAVQTLIRDSAHGSKDGDDSGSPSQTSEVAFVIAADGAWLRRSFELIYGDFSNAIAEPGRGLGYLFMDKLFQLRAPVPSLDDTAQELYLRELLKIDPTEVKSNLRSEEQTVLERVATSESAEEAAQAVRQASPTVRIRVAPSVIARLTEPEGATATEHRLRKFGPLLAPNPRSMKRFINDYSIVEAVRLLEGCSVGGDSLALWTIIETRWPALADYLREKPDDVAYIGDASDISSSPSEIAGLFKDPDVRQVVQFEHGGPLTSEVIRTCCGALREMRA